MFRPPQRSHHQAGQNHKKEIIYIKVMGEILTLQKKLLIYKYTCIYMSVGKTIFFKKSNKLL